MKFARCCSLFALAALLLSLSGGAAATMQAPAAGGSLPGAFESGPDGAATYRIPIQVAEGINGLRPSLALSYHSHQGDGLAGIGWRLAGLSEIRRCGRTIAAEGERSGVRFAPSDRFCLDGQPLRLQSGSYGAAGAEYRQEIHRHERIISHGQHGTGKAAGPAWFSVEHPNGLTYRYGHQPDARILAAGRDDQAVISWALDEIRDRWGNRILFSWQNDAQSGEHLPHEVHWSVAAGAGPESAAYRLHFSYEARPAADVQRGFLWGSHHSRSQRLRTISYEYRGDGGFSVVHEYLLDYAVPSDAGSGRSRLASIRQCGPTSCLPATSLMWASSPAGFGSEYAGNAAVDSDRTLTGDFTGNGFNELLTPVDGNWLMYPFDPGSGQYGAALATGLADTGAAVRPIAYSSAAQTEVMVESAAGSGQWTIYRADAHGQFSAVADYLLGADASSVSPLDTDGDGLDDLVYFTGSGSARQLILRRNSVAGFGAPLTTAINVASVPWLINEASGLGWSGGRRADFDGDGREDLLLRLVNNVGGLPGAIYVAYLSTGDDFDPNSYLYTAATATRALVTDMNGDGLTDLVYHERDSGRWLAVLSKAGNHESGTQGMQRPVCDASQLSSADSVHARTLDFNGNGHTDLLLPDGDGWRVYLGDGQCFSSTRSLALGTSASTPAVTSRLLLSDLTGDGRSDLLFIRNDGSVRLRQRSGSAGELLSRVRDGLGNVTMLSHAPLLQSGRYHVETASGDTDDRLLPGASLPVLTQSMHSDGNGWFYTRSYRYWNARRSLDGGRFLGFERIRISDDRDHGCSDAEYLQSFPFTRQLARRVRFTTSSLCDSAGDPAPQTRISDFSAIWAQYPAAADAGEARFVYRAAETSSAYEVDPLSSFHGQLSESLQRSYDYDHRHGAVAVETSERTAPQWPGSVWRTVISRELAEVPRASYWCLGLPERVSVQREQPGSPPATRVTAYSYDQDSRCTPAASSEGPAAKPTEQLQTRWERDAAGRITAITLADAAGQTAVRRSEIGWDSTGLRPASLRNLIDGEPDPQITYQWHHALGLPAAQTSPHQQRIEWEWDEFGRLAVENSPGALLTTNELFDCAPGSCWLASRARYRQRLTRSDGAWSETLHDSRGRIIGEAAGLDHGTEGRRQFEYNNHGQLVRESQPYLAGQQIYWTTYSHDARGRLTRADRPVSADQGSGRVTSLAYNRLNITVVDPEQRSTTYFHDPYGRLLLVQAPLLGGAAYSYTPFGELSEIWDAEWNRTRLDYDERGRLSRVEHPDSGEWRYTWNIFGELVQQQDDQQPPQLISWSYDQLGRPRQRVEAEGITSWTWHTQDGPAFGQLHTVSGPTDLSSNGYHQHWEYGDLALPTELTTSIDGKTYLTSRSYDEFGRLERMRWPETMYSFRPEFAWRYGSNGRLRTIEQLFPFGSTPVYTVAATDASGRAEEVVYGDSSLHSRREHDRASGQLIAISSSTAGGESLQDYRYRWDLAGNLAERGDLDQGLVEQFGHDALNRLVSVTRNGEPALLMHYSGSGNLLHKSDVGNYSYQSGRPRAVSLVSGGPRGSMNFSYDGNGNMSMRHGGRIHWTSFNQPREINLQGDNCSGTCSRFVYGPQRELIKQRAFSNGQASTIHYVGPHFEVEYLPDGHIRFLTRVLADGQAVLGQSLDTNWQWDSWFILRDHLGSVDRLVQDFGSSTGTLHPFSFDAWGQRRWPDWQPDSAGELAGLAVGGRRGFTGHEQLDRLGLIHMHGRVHDPLLGRMLSPDPFLGEPAATASLNAYAYAWNSPLRMIDPGGLQAQDFSNFRPDPVTFQHRSMNDPIGRYAELWVAGWGGALLGGGSAYLASRIYLATMTMSPAHRTMVINAILEVSGGTIAASLPLDEQQPPVGPLPNPPAIERPDDRDPPGEFTQVGTPGGSIVPGNGTPGLPSITPALPVGAGAGTASVPAAVQPGERIQYSYIDDNDHMVIRMADPDSGACKDCHGQLETVTAAPQVQGWPHAARMRATARHSGEAGADGPPAAGE